MVSKLANRIIVGGLAGVLIASGAGLGAASVGMIPAAPLDAIDPAAYVLPLPDSVDPAAGLDGVNTKATSDGDKIEKALDSLSRGGIGTVSYSVMDLTSRQLVSERGSIVGIPASSWKVITSMAVLSAYGSEHRFSTTVVASSDGIVLVGGGDPYLTEEGRFHSKQARIQDLAEECAKALLKSGKTLVTLGYDDSLFAGPGWHPDWLPVDVIDVSPVAALSVDPNGGMYSDTALSAARTFRDLLVEHGINVVQVRAERAAQGGTVLASVDSLPLGLIVQRVLETSDNYAAEVLFRHVSVGAGGDGSSDAAAKALQNYLVSKELWNDKMIVSDGSGLSLVTRVSPYVLAKAILVATQDPKLADVLKGLPVAGVDGTLKNRFNDSDEANGRGVVRAKTGTHDYDLSLTGFVQTSSGAVLVFSFMVTNVTSVYRTQDWIDEAASAIAATG
ncbi:MAG: D-alanyl-D-alanine carboxypeptidase/D-alanyl-D-alanine-endopeptidase [Propionibacteriaceae bacterium]|nr:D-alanyl-D-alanine carboxypeptidase/D-alanyl-D-alanine-endopeptidase [Propionibacteriaceae bacterium]